MKLSTVALLASASVVIGCDPPKTSHDNIIIGVDGGTAEPPGTPELQAYPSATPYPVITLRGRAPNAKRLIAFGTANPNAATVLPDGMFCLDVPLPQAGTYNLELVSLSELGLMSESSARVSVTYDPSGPGVSGLSTCNGASPASCVEGADEVCGNGMDDDCDGRVDAADSDCAACHDDAMEPNDNANAPSIDPARLDNLMLCPGNIDNYRVLVREGETITARTFFDNDMGDLDLRLFAADGTTKIVESASSDDIENVTYTATATGRLMVQVYGYTAEVTNSYSLDVAVTGD